jgi:Fe-S cluster assembly protein SufD
MKRKIVILDKPGKKKVVVSLINEGEEVEVLGLVMGKEKGDYELGVVVDHKSSKTKGRVSIRGIAKSGAKIKITGLIKIDKNSQEVDSFLEMRVLILDNKSWATVEPKLEIEANLVKASHAATVSKIDEEQLFYLTSRGIKKEVAEGLIVTGFLKEITDKIILSKSGSPNASPHIAGWLRAGFGNL